MTTGSDWEYYYFLMLVMAFYFINILTLPDTVFYISYYSIILEMGYKKYHKRAILHHIEGGI